MRPHCLSAFLTSDYAICYSIDLIDLFPKYITIVFLNFNLKFVVYIRFLINGAYTLVRLGLFILSPVLVFKWSWYFYTRFRLTASLLFLYLLRFIVLSRFYFNTARYLLHVSLIIVFVRLQVPLDLIHIFYLRLF